MKLPFLLLALCVCVPLHAQTKIEPIEIRDPVAEKMLTFSSQFTHAKLSPKPVVNSEKKPALYGIDLSRITAQESDLRSLEDLDTAIETVMSASESVLKRDKAHFRPSYMVLYHLKEPGGATIWIGWFKASPSNFGKTINVPIAITGSGGRILKLVVKDSFQSFHNLYNPDYISNDAKVTKALIGK